MVPHMFIVGDMICRSPERGYTTLVAVEQAQALRLAAGTAAGHVDVLDITCASLLASLPAAPKNKARRLASSRTLRCQLGFSCRVLHTHTHNCMRACVRANHVCYASNSCPPGIVALSAHSGSLAGWAVQESPVSSLSACWADGGSLAVGFYSGWLSMLDLRSGHKVAEWEAHAKSVTGLAATGTQLVSVSQVIIRLPRHSIYSSINSFK